jgi:hypothetical protein
MILNCFERPIIPRAPREANFFRSLSTNSSAELDLEFDPPPVCLPNKEAENSLYSIDPEPSTS